MSSATLQDGKILLRSVFEDKDFIRTIPGRRWIPEIKRWELPLSVESYTEILKIKDIQIDSKVILAVNEVRDQLHAVNAFKQTDGEVYPIEPMPIKTKPYRHQILGYNIGITLDNSGLFMEQGCGKTLSAIAIMGWRYKQEEIKRVLIVAPASVLPVWISELDKHADFEYEAECLEKSTAKRREFLKTWKYKDRLQIAIINYEGVWRLIPYKADRKPKWRLDESVFSLSWRPDMIVCDESQRIKSIKASQSKGMHKLAEIAKYRMILTGTPVTQTPLDLFSQFRFLDSSIFGTVYWNFRNQYAVPIDYNGWKWEVPKSKIPLLAEKVNSITYRITKKEALDLPETVDQELYCELEPKAMAQYQEMKRESLMELRSGEVVTAANVLVRLLRLSQITGGYMKNSDERITCISEEKMKLLKATIDDIIGAGKKAVIFARFLPEIAAIRKLCDGDKKKKRDPIRYAWIAGEVKDRGSQVEMFQNDPECMIFIAQIQTAGLGITLTAADIEIYYSLSYSFADYDQARARIHRIGQVNKCTYMHLIAKGTIDEKVLKVLKNKKSVADEVIDNWRDYFED